MKSRIIVMVVAFWGMTAIWAQDSTPWYMGTWVSVSAMTQNNVK